MRKHHQWQIVLVSVAVLVFCLPWPGIAKDVALEDQRRAKNIILMVPDGMGLANVTAARITRNGINGDPLWFETLEEIGYQRTHSANSTVTDSAAAAAAWACGEKFMNGEICFHSDGRPYQPSLLELAQQKGKTTGLVATSTITHATPAAFGAHVWSRSCENEIARQYVRITRPNVMLGGGRSRFNATAPDRCGAYGDYLTEAEHYGYTVVTSRDAMLKAASSGVMNLLGLFSTGGMTPEYLRTPDTSEPRLPEMTKAALDVLERDKNGLFVVVEGSQIDWANHANNLTYQIGETLAFDEAVKVVLDWIDARPERGRNTLLIIAADHETGGFALNGDEDGGMLGDFQPGWTSGGHTAVDTVIWSRGPGSRALGRAIDNTDIYRIVTEAMN